MGMLQQAQQGAPDRLPAGNLPTGGLPAGGLPPSGQAAMPTAPVGRPPMSPTGDMDLNRPMDGKEALRLSRLASQPGASSALAEPQPATPEEQEEYDRASEIVQRALYEDGQIADGFENMLSPNEKVGSVAKAVIFGVSTLDSEYDFDEVIIPALTEEMTDRVIEIYEKKFQDEFSEPETQSAFGAAWEGVMQLYGTDADQYAELTQGMTEDDYDAMESEYHGMLKQAGQR